MGDMDVIKQRLARSYYFARPGTADIDIAYLVTENERLEREVAYMRDHPGWVPPQTGSEK